MELSLIDEEHINMDYYKSSVDSPNDKESQLLKQISNLHGKLDEIRQSREKKEKYRNLLHATLASNKSSPGQKITKRDIGNSNKVILVTRKLPFRIQRVHDNVINSNTSVGNQTSNVPLASPSFMPRATPIYTPNNAIPPSPIVTSCQSTTSSNLQTISKWKIEVISSSNTDEGISNALSVYNNFPCIWIGTVDCDVHPSEQAELKHLLLTEYNCVPVFIEPYIDALFYLGYCKRILWPLFHCTLPSNDDFSSLMQDNVDSESDYTLEKMWNAYKLVNQSFADVIQGLYNEKDVLLIKEYHFMLLPKMIRNLFPSHLHTRTGFFIQIPFPSSELYRMLVHREEILNGILDADLIGFQTYEYARHFQSACIRILGLETNHKGIRNNGHFARLTICPMGIDPDNFQQLLTLTSIQDRISALKEEFKGKKVILGVDNLDPTKGLVNKFLAIDELFKCRPELAKEIAFIQIVLPPPFTLRNSVLRSNTSGTGSYYSSHSSLVAAIPPEYSALETQLETMVARINGKLQVIGGKPPIQYLIRDMPMEELVALFAIADIFLSTSIRAGLNLIPFEYIVCREKVGNTAIVLLSEFAGSSQCLSGATIMNPWDTEEIKDSLYKIITEQKANDRLQNHQYMYQYVSSFTANKWGINIVEQIIEANETEENLHLSRRELTRRDIYVGIKHTKRRLIILGYEDVLATNSTIPELAQVSEECLHWLSIISNENVVVILSNRSRHILDKWFSNINGNIILVAESGVFIKWSNYDPWRFLTSSGVLDNSWWKDVASLLDYYSERTPGSYIEKKESSITWHYKDCDKDHGFWQATELLMTLRDVTHSLPISIQTGNKSLEILPSYINKAALFERIWEYLHTKAADRSIELIGEIYIAASPRDPFRKPLPYETSSTTNSYISRSRAGSGASAVSLPVSCSSAMGRTSTNTIVSSDTETYKNSGSATDLPSKLDNANEEVGKFDFILVMVSGEDRTDEDLIEVLVPPPLDLREYCSQLVKESSDTSNTYAEVMPAPLGISIEKLKEKQINNPNIESRSLSNNDIIERKDIKALLNKEIQERVLPRSSSASNVLRDVAKGAKGLRNSLDYLPARLPISDDAIGKFPLSLLKPTISRQEEISNLSKFTPRKDFPPSAALFHAMRRKYGNDFDSRHIPVDAAAAWALVCPPNTRGIIEGNGGLRGTPASSLSSVSETDEQDINKKNLETSEDRNVQTDSVSSPAIDASGERFPLHTFVCTIGTKLSQAPYYLKKASDVQLYLKDIGKLCQQQKKRERSNSQSGYVP